MVDQPVQSRLDTTTQAIFNCLEQLWSDEEYWPQYIEAMHLALGNTEPVSPRLPSFLHLPGLCCQAAGGEPLQAVSVAAAWALLYTAAHLLDDVEDGEVVGSAAPATVNIATGLIFTAVRALAVSPGGSMIEQARVTLIEDFTRTALQISCGQHADLVGGASSLEQCWEIVDAKSGACFALACRSGATLAGVDPEIIGYYSQFGHHLGVAIQIIDDLQGIGESNGAHSDLVVGKRTLPVWYTLSVTSPESQARLLHCLHAAPHDPMAEALARNLIEESGAALYLSIEARSHGIQALACLNMANPQVAPRDQLVRLLTKVCPI